SVWESYSAFANSFGGTIVLGLEEAEGGALRAVGLKDADKTVNDIWNAINNPQKVSRNILVSDDVRVIVHDGRRMVSIDVPRADRHDRPVYVNGQVNNGTFRRNGPNDYKCSMPEIAGMMRDNTDTALDSHALDGFDMGDIDGGALSRYRSLMKANDEGHVWSALPDSEFLRLIGAAEKDAGGELRPTQAGLLMFGLEYRISKEFPDYKVDYLEHVDPGADWEYRIVSGDGRWTGNLFDFYVNAANRLKLSIGRPFAIGDGWRRVDDTDIDKAVRESLINALIHADYRGRMGVRVEVRPGVVTVRNPGLFRMPIRDAEAGGRSDPRNPTLAKMFTLTGVAERAGSGLYRIIETWKRNGFEPPRIEESLIPPTVKVTLPMRMDPKTTSIPDEERVLGLIRSDGGISLDKVSKETGLSRSKVDRIVKGLRESGRLERTGGKKGGHWIVR
ncbi:MAG: putative DNA binding domain-containing protein, partial [Methanomassiliicoccaceae archaeon]|nr:putative DNA binding domain-containing protein [Methanomassiliicoccaceae archaeon]